MERIAKLWKDELLASCCFSKMRLKMGRDGRYKYHKTDYEWYGIEIKQLSGWINRKVLYGRILDLGCGTSKVAEQLAENGYTVKSIDFSDECISYMKKKYLNRANECRLEGILVRINLGRYSNGWTGFGV